MTSTKKILAGFDPYGPKQASSDFLVPVYEGDSVVLFGTKSKRTVAYGMVVFVGREITVNDVFASLVDSGRKIPNVTDQLAAIQHYLTILNSVKIGQVFKFGNDQSANATFTLSPVKIPRKEGKGLLP